MQVESVLLGSSGNVSLERLGCQRVVEEHLRCACLLVGSARFSARRVFEQGVGTAVQTAGTLVKPIERRDRGAGMSPAWKGATGVMQMRARCLTLERECARNA